MSGLLAFGRMLLTGSSRPATGCCLDCRCSRVSCARHGCRRPEKRHAAGRAGGLGSFRGRLHAGDPGEPAVAARFRGVGAVAEAAVATWPAAPVRQPLGRHDRWPCRLRKPPGAGPAAAGRLRSRCRRHLRAAVPAGCRGGRTAPRPCPRLPGRLRQRGGAGRQRQAGRPAGRSEGRRGAGLARCSPRRGW